MIDVGANLGYFSLLWVAANPANKCIAFEASPRNIDLLTRNVTGNGFESQVRVFRQAAGKESGLLDFSPGPDDQTGWGGLVLAAAPGTVTVDVVRIDEAVACEEEIAILKVDTEGADTWVLMGCERLLRERRVREVWFEQNKPRMRTLGIGERDAEEFLRSVGYAARPRSNPNADLVEWSAAPASG
jgi:FkbM family methyltransferase